MPRVHHRKCIHLLAAAVLLTAIHVQAATLERPPFTIVYANGQEALAIATANELETAAAAQAYRLPLGKTPVHVTICDTVESFREISGGLPAMRIEGFARSREGIIVLKAPRLLGPNSNYAAIARHELLHVLLARNTNPDNLPRWLNEGVAMIVSRENRWESSFSMARMYLGGRVIEYADLAFVFNAPGNETVFGEAYVQSLSMTRFLNSRLSEEAFWSMIDDLNDKSFEQALRERTGLTAANFYQAWRDSLWRLALGFWVITGFSVFQVAAVLLVIAYLRKRAKNRRLVEAWSTEYDEIDDL